MHTGVMAGSPVVDPNLVMYVISDSTESMFAKELKKRGISGSKWKTVEKSGRVEGSS